LDVDKFYDFAFEKTKRCLGDLFKTWPAVGWEGSKREFKRSFREGAASANGECLVAAFATVAEAQRLVDELHKRLSPNLALTRQVTNRVTGTNADSAEAKTPKKEKTPSHPQERKPELPYQLLPLGSFPASGPTHFAALWSSTSTWPCHACGMAPIHGASFRCITCDNPGLAPPDKWVKHESTAYSFSPTMSTGDKVKFDGRMPKSVCINFYDAEGNIVFHLNPRQTEGCVVRNACYNGEWGSEERAGGLPFAVGRNLSVIVEKTSDGFAVVVDGVRIPALDFAQRQAGNVVQVDVTEAQPKPQASSDGELGACVYACMHAPVLTCALGMLCALHIPRLR
jgi:hypothetical protein